MFNKSFTCSVTTDADGHFQESTTVQASRMLTVHADVRATLLSPADTAVSGTFSISPGAAREFHGSTNETVDLGRWKISAGQNTASAQGTTIPPRPNAEFTVRFDASV